ncbi:MAG: FtsK/SpoIIIE domain-containing protein [Mycobacteriales bacterium]
MQLRFTVAAAPARPAVDVEVSAAEGTTLGELRPALLAALGTAASPGALYAGSTALGARARLGAPPLTHGALLQLGPGDRAAPHDVPTLLELWVVGGPDAGPVFGLTAGQVRIGRDPEGEIALDDPDVSRSHALVTVTDDGVSVRDLGSTNGTTLDGRLLTCDPVPLTVGSRVRVGESTLVLATPDDPALAVRPDGGGRLAVNRPPRLAPPEPTVEVAYPAEPVAPDRPRFPVLTLVIPLVIGAVMVKVMGSWTFALFMLLSPLMLGANFVSDRVGAGRRYRKARAAYERALAAADVRLRAAVEAEARDRRVAAPDAPMLLRAAAGPRRRLWERRPVDRDALTLRLGSADLPALLTVRPDDAAAPPWHPVIPDVPVTVPLGEVGVLGLAGPPARLGGLARHVVAQLAALHSPRDLDLIILCDPVSDAAHRWHWARWLPHLMPARGEDCSLLVGLTPAQISARVAELIDTLDARMTIGPGSARWTGRATVLVLDGARTLRGVPGMARLLESGRQVGIYAVCLSVDPLDLPQECGATAVVTGDVSTRLTVRRMGHPPVLDAVADLVSDQWAREFARRLAPMRDATPEHGHAALPASARLLDILGLDPPTAPQIVARWEAGTGSTTALIGVAHDGAYVVDLPVDGPHALVAGTTGAGKSELLQTLVASLAAGARPDQMTFVLVDYKGGSAFKDCARLPHTVGMVTDLDGHLTQRALSSLDAELKRRERVLGAAGCKDIDDYKRAGSPSGPVPRLALVIDEFASLVQELPDFVTGLVDLARRGRSLGVHLILATQRPAGVVSADIRANTNLRIALRVTDPAESQDVIDAKDAALIDRSTPGRAICRTGAGGVVAFQSARIGGRPARDIAGTPCVRTLTWAAAGDPPPIWPGASDDEGPTDLSRLVEAVREAARSMGISAPASPWLPPLPPVVALTELIPSGPEMLPIGLVDLPAEQTRAAYELDLAHGGHLLVVGGPRSGRTTLLRTVAGSLARHAAATDVHLHALDCAGGGLAPLASLPHTGAVVARDDTERGDRVLTRLVSEVARRQQILGQGGFGSLVEQRAAATGEPLPWLLLMLDGWEGFVSAYETIDGGRPVETMLRLLREGPGVGLRAVVAGDRSALTGRVSSLMPARLVLRMPDDIDYALAGLTPRQLPEVLRPGQAMIPGEVVTECQVALLSGDPAGPAQVAELTRLAKESDAQAAALSATPRPFRVDALPERVAYPSVAAAVPPDAGPLWTPIGLGGDELAVVGIELGEDAPAFVISGPARSGRSTALITMASGLIHRRVTVLAVTPRRSPLSRLDGVSGVYAVTDSDRFRAVVAGVDGPLAVFADDAEALLDTPLADELCEMLRRTTHEPWAIVVAGLADEMAASYRGIAADARRHRVGLLLSPTSPVDGDVFGVRLSRGFDARPGRGLLCNRGTTMPVQVADCDASAEAAVAELSRAST